MDLLNNLQLNAPSWAIAAGASLVFIFVVLIIKRIILNRLQKVVIKTPYIWDDVLLNAIRLPSTILVFVAGLILFAQTLFIFDVPDQKITPALNVLSKLLIVSAVIIFLDKLAFNALSQYSTKSQTVKNSQGIVKGVVRGIVLALGALVLLSTLGISITPILASLGIGSLAVALALQPTLENFFSGVQLVVDKPFRVGDYIELDSGEQGFVEKIGWRSTWIKMLPNNTVIMPNSVLSQSKVINYFYPAKELSVPVDVGVHYDSDLEHVERVTLEVAREILKSHKWGVATYETFVVFHTFDNSSINFTVMLRAQEYFNRFFIKSEFIKALHRRFAEEGIVIPYPIRAINLAQEKSGNIDPNA